MKVSLPRVSAEGGPRWVLPSHRSTQTRPVFQEGAGTLSDSYDRDKAAFRGKDAESGIFEGNRPLSLLPIKNIRNKSLI